MEEDLLDQPSGDERPLPGPRFLRPGSRRLIKWLLLGFLAAVLFYYPVGMLIVSRINDDPLFAAPPVPPGGSQAVAVTAALIDREVRQTSWTGNDPFFLPGALLDNMPNFQLGLKEALARFAAELVDQFGRTRGSSRADPDLDRAAGLLKYPANVWFWNPNVSLAPTASSESQYLAAMKALESYNARLARGDAVFERRADNLLGALDRIAADLGSASAVIDEQIALHAGDWVDWRADDIFYNTKGRLYAYGLLMRDLGTDYQAIINERDMRAVWQQTVDGLLRGAALRPWVVINGRPDALVEPSHLAAIGFYLLRARTQLRELTNVLQK